MTLREWLDREGKTTQEFAVAIGRTSETVRRYIAGDRIPDKETMPLIVTVTGGAVTPNDFFGITEGAVTVPPKVEGDTVAMCSRCGERAEASQVSSCTSVHCPMRTREAA